ncbi:MULTISPECIES: hypothetical protein [unclassified Halobacteriovorax]|uniref:hypothetical protein n=1 Tax=unclassified Halobacteriovorax TaxID=2639665 RepID=UPI00371EC557
MNKKLIILISPRFEREIECPTGHNRQILQKGPFANYFKSNTERFLFVLFTILTLGGYAYYLIKNGNNIRIRKLLDSGYRLKFDSDIFYVKKHVGYRFIDSKEGDKVRFARTGSADDTLKL